VGNGQESSALDATRCRILVIGCGGAGKSTVARRIGDTLQLPVVHLDQLYWRSGWVPTPPDEWAHLVASLCAREHWVMDGNYGGTIDARLAACDAVIFLDAPRYVCLWRVVRRAIRYRGRTRPDLAEGCRERLTWEFVSWIWTYAGRRRPGILTKLAALPHDKRSIVLRSSRDVDRFLHSLQN